jgi:hypothetical protein
LDKKGSRFLGALENGAGGCDDEDGFVTLAKLELPELFALPLLLGGIELFNSVFYVLNFLKVVMLLICGRKMPLGDGQL